MADEEEPVKNAEQPPASPSDEANEADAATALVKAHIESVGAAPGYVVRLPDNINRRDLPLRGVVVDNMNRIWAIGEDAESETLTLIGSIP